MAADFHELQQPFETKMKRWYVLCSHTFLTYLDIHGQIIQAGIGTKNSDLYFDTEYDALRMACDYYHQQAKPYPFIARMVEVGKLITKDMGTEDPTTNESQVMVFK